MDSALNSKHYERKPIFFGQDFFAGQRQYFAWPANSRSTAFLPPQPKRAGHLQHSWGGLRAQVEAL